jgi:hypothetical protein
MTPLPLLPALAASLTLLAPARPAAPVDTAPPTTAGRQVMQGTFTDRDGARHPWSISPAHALVWEGATQVPVGTVWAPKSLSPAAMAAAWEQDSAELDRMKAGGARDVAVLCPSDAASTPAETWQRLVDALEVRQLRYGFVLRPARAPLDAWIDRPLRQRLAAAEVSARRVQRSVRLEGCSSVAYSIAAPDTETPVGGVVAVDADGIATVDVKLPLSLIGATPPDLILLPRRRLPAESGLPDLWTDLAGHRGEMVALLSRIKWGPGLRFLVDPLGAPLSLTGDARYAWPAGGSWQIAFEAWLERRYSLDDLRQAWAVKSTGRSIESLVEAARLIPLWRPDEALLARSWAVDVQSGAFFEMDARRSRLWYDLTQFRLESIRDAMDTMAATIKRRAVDVPVLYTWTGHHPLFTNDGRGPGFDGLVLAATDRPDETRDDPGLLLAQAEEAIRTSWLMLLTTAPRGAAPAEAETLKPESLISLRDAGIRAFFTPGASPGAVSATVADPAAAEQRPAVCFYPIGAGMSLRPRRLASGAWWLPSYAAGAALDMGEVASGYHIARDVPGGPGGSRVLTTYVWAPAPRLLTLATETSIEVFDTRGQLVKQSRPDKKGQVRLEVGPEPVIVRGFQARPLVPVEAVTQSLERMEALLRIARQRKIDTGIFRSALASAQGRLKAGLATEAYELLREPLAAVNRELAPYAWIEAERPFQSSFDGAILDPDTAGGAYLRLNPASPAPEGGHYASYVISLAAPADAEIYVSVTASGSGPTRPLTVQVDGTKPVPLAGAPDGTYGAASFGWLRAGRVRLAAGDHRITVRLADPPGTSPTAVVALDALMLTSNSIRPKGPRPPEWLNPK